MLFCRIHKTHRPFYPQKQQIRFHVLINWVKFDVNVRGRVTSARVCELSLPCWKITRTNMVRIFQFRPPLYPQPPNVIRTQPKFSWDNKPALFSFLRRQFWATSHGRDVRFNLWVRQSLFFNPGASRQVDRRPRPWSTRKTEMRLVGFLVLHDSRAEERKVEEKVDRNQNNTVSRSSSWPGTVWSAEIWSNCHETHGGPFFRRTITNKSSLNPKLIKFSFVTCCIVVEIF